MSKEIGFINRSPREERAPAYPEESAIDDGRLAEVVAERELVEAEQDAQQAKELRGDMLRELRGLGESALKPFRALRSKRSNNE